jgi:AcrR family transcriptional regulator
MDDVADRAGVGKATIYRRYRSKDELVTDAVATLVGEIEIPDTGSTRSDLLALMRHAVELYSGSLAARLMPTVIDEMRRNPELASAVRDEFLAGRRGSRQRSARRTNRSRPKAGRGLSRYEGADREK